MSAFQHLHRMFVTPMLARGGAIGNVMASCDISSVSELASWRDVYLSPRHSLSAGISAVNSWQCKSLAAWHDKWRRMSHQKRIVYRSNRSRSVIMRACSISAFV